MFQLPHRQATESVTSLEKNPKRIAAVRVVTVVH